MSCSIGSSSSYSPLSLAPVVPYNDGLDLLATLATLAWEARSPGYLPLTQREISAVPSSPSETPASPTQKRVENLDAVIALEPNKRRRIIDESEDEMEINTHHSPPRIEVDSDEEQSSSESNNTQKENRSKIEVFDFYDPKYIQRKSVQELNEIQLEKTKRSVLEKAAAYPCLKEVPVMRILSFGIHDNFSHKTSISLHTVVLSWANSLPEKLSDKEIDDIYKALFILRPFFKTVVKGFNRSLEGPNQPGNFSLADFELTDPRLQRPTRIAELSAVEIERVKKQVLDEAKNFPILNIFPSEDIWLMSVVSIPDNFGTTAQVKHFVNACFEKLPKASTASLDIDKASKALIKLKRFAKDKADPRPGRQLQKLNN